MDEKKLMIGCGLGMLIGIGIALVFAPMFWWLGMIAGGLAGYLCYDFKEVREKAPIAWQIAKKGSRYFLGWLKKPHPFLWPTLIIWGVFTFFLVKSIWWGNFFGEGIVSVRDKTISTVCFSLVTFYCCVCLFPLPLTGLALIAARRKKILWEPPSIWIPDVGKQKKIEEENYQIIPVTYKNIYGLMLTGLGGLLLTMITATPKVVKGIGIGLVMILRFVFYGIWLLLARFIWYLFKLIHFNDRVVCGIDCVIGVALIYMLLGVRTETFPQDIFIMICAGVIGLVVGKLHYRIAQLVHLVPVDNK